MVYALGGFNSVSRSFPLNFTLTGPILAVNVTVYSLSADFSMLSQPDIHSFSVSGSLSARQTLSCAAGTSWLLDISIVRFPYVTPLHRAKPCAHCRASAALRRAGLSLPGCAPAETHRHTAASRGCRPVALRIFRSAAAGSAK